MIAGMLRLRFVAFAGTEWRSAARAVHALAVAAEACLAFVQHVHLGGLAARELEVSHKTDITPT
jgi:hypothetical protein